MMIWLPGFPGAGLPPNTASTFDQVSVQSTGVVPRSAGTILATARFRRTTRISWPRATNLSSSGKADCTCSTVTVFTPDKVVAANAPGKDDVRGIPSARTAGMLIAPSGFPPRVEHEFPG